MSNSLMVGENRQTMPYKIGAGDSNEGYRFGFDIDTVRWSFVRPDLDSQEIAVNYKRYTIFGSAHLSGFHTVSCDGTTDLASVAQCRAS